MKRQFRHTRRGYPPTCCWGGIHRSATAFYRIHPRLKKPWYSAKADNHPVLEPCIAAELIHPSYISLGKADREAIRNDVKNFPENPKDLDALNMENLRALLPR